MPSQIEWTDETWNPVRGCAVVSAGCTNCYAMKQAHRFSGPGGPYEGLTQLSNGGPVWTGKVRLVQELLDRPGRWRRPRRIFVNSMSDLFHEDVPDEFIAAVFREMAGCIGKHTFQILTKRPERMLGFLARCAKSESGYITHNGQNPKGFAPGTGEIVTYPTYTEEFKRAVRLSGPAVVSENWPLPNVALGVSVENQATADERIPPLLDTPAAVRWISAEPLLGPIDLNWISAVPYGGEECRGIYIGALTGGQKTDSPWHLNWVVAGGESGPGARPMYPDWIRQLRDQCVDADVPFFFKQWGAWAPAPADVRAALGIFPDGTTCRPNDPRYVEETPPRLWKPGKKAAGRELDGEIWDQMPDFFRHSSGTVGDR